MAIIADPAGVQVRPQSDRSHRPRPREAFIAGYSQRPRRGVTGDPYIGVTDPKKHRGLRKIAEDARLQPFRGSTATAIFHWLTG
jgi:hypothetical protein